MIENIYGDIANSSNIGDSNESLDALHRIIDICGGEFNNKARFIPGMELDEIVDEAQALHGYSTLNGFIYGFKACLILLGKGK